MLQPTISAADEGTWFVDRGGCPHQVIRFYEGSDYPALGAGEELAYSWASSGAYQVGSTSSLDLVRRAAPADFLRIAVSLAGEMRETDLLVLADFAEELGLPLAQAIREAVESGARADRNQESGIRRQESVGGGQAVNEVPP